jgi:broad specificity phosphatase PhoE
VKQAYETGVFLDSILSAEGITTDDIVWLSSPFLRCLQTSHTAIDSFHLVKGSVDEIRIFPEYSIFEWDGQDGKFHKSLPDLNERKHYFPRLDVDYESVFTPKLPEPRSEFLDRCQQAAAAISRRYPFRPKSAIVAVTHAAGCIGLASAFTNQSASDITPAAPCSIYRLTRTSDTSAWTLDPHDQEHSMNGHTAHISDLGKTTMPWNNFADKKCFQGYTGPATSRFAPVGYADHQEL